MSSKESLPIDNGEKQKIIREHPFLAIFLEASNPSSEYQDNCAGIAIAISEIADAAYDNELQEGEKSLPEILANFVTAGYAEKVFSPQTELSVLFNSLIVSQIQFAYFLGGDIGNEGIELFSEQIIESIKRIEILALDDQGQVPQQTHEFFKKVMKEGADFYSQHPYLKEMFTDSIHVTSDISQLGQPKNPNSGKSNIIDNFLRRETDKPSMN